MGWEGGPSPSPARRWAGGEREWRWELGEREQGWKDGGEVGAKGRRGGGEGEPQALPQPGHKAGALAALYLGRGGGAQKGLLLGAGLATVCGLNKWPE